MYKITFFVPKVELIELTTKMFEEHNRFEYENGIENAKEYSCDVYYYSQLDDISKVKLETDAIIARGIVASYLRSKKRDAHVIEIPIMGNDLLYALNKSRQIYGNEVIGAIGSYNMINDVENIAEVLGLKAKAYYVKIYAEDVMKKFVREARDEGCRVILSGYNTCEYAKSLGLNAVVIESRRQSVWQAITEAKRAASVKHIEQEKALRVKAILDYAQEGIIAVDRLGVITSINGQAERILEINSSGVIGKMVDKVITDSNFCSSIINNKEYVDEVMTYRKIQLTVNKVPLIYRDENIGSVVTFQDITKVQETEGKIRDKIYLRGHVARYNFEDVIGNGKKLRDVKDMARRFAKVNSNILICGGTGTGKELFAQSIHNVGDRRKGPFVAINCAALPENLLESELFGYVEGAFTGATKSGKPGMFELAHRGTIFLDEISELPLKLQGRLLRVIQERSIMRLGHDRVISVDVRIIAATNKDLRVLSEQGEFREDLYFRLNVLKLDLPSLREHPEDIPLLIKTYIDRYAKEFCKEDLAFDEKALELLQKYSWPGNIRELQNICERLVVLADDSIISSSAVELAFSDKDIKDKKKKEMNREKTEAVFLDIDEDPDNLKYQIAGLEKQRIIEALNMFYGNKVKAAKYLGISRSMLWRRMKQMNIPQNSGEIQ